MDNYDIETLDPQALLKLIAQGQEVLLSKGDIPLARLVRLEVPKPKCKAGRNLGAMEMADDFDAPLPDSFWLGTPPLLEEA